MKYFNKLAAILSTFACASLCMGMEKLSEEQRENLIQLASNLPLEWKTPEEFLEKTYKFVELSIEENGFLPSLESLDNLKSLSVPEQLLAFTKIFASIQDLTQLDVYYTYAFEMANNLSRVNLDIRCHGFLFLFQTYIEINDEKKWYDCLCYLKTHHLNSAEREKIENILVRIFSTRPEVIMQLQHFIHCYTQSESETINFCFLNALCQLKSVPKLDNFTCDRIGGSYSKLSFQIADMEMKKKYVTQAILYFVLGAKAGNTTSFKSLIACLEGAPSRTHYYTFLFPLLRMNDPEAQDLFNKICDESQLAWNWFEKYKDKQQENKKHPHELEMVERVHGNYYHYKGEKEYQAALDRWESRNPAEALNHLLEAHRFNSREAIKKLKEIRESEQYNNPNRTKKDTLVSLLKERDKKLSKEKYQEYIEKKAEMRKNYQCSVCPSVNFIFHLILAADLGYQQAIEEVACIKKSTGYTLGLNGTDLDNPKSLSFDDYLGYFFGRYESARNEEEGGTPKGADNREHDSNEPVIGETNHKTNNTNSPHHVSIETISTTTASSTTLATSTRKKGKYRKKQEMRPSSITPTTSMLVEQKDSISSSLVQDIGTPLSTMSGEGGNAPMNDHQESRDHSKVEKQINTNSENQNPNPDDKAPKIIVRKTLERSNSAKVLSRRGSSESGLNAEESLKGESKRKELRRTVTLTSIPTSSSKDQSKGEVVNENTKHDKKTLAKKFKLSSLKPWKDKNSKEGAIEIKEKSSEKPKSKRLSNASTDHSTSKSESESKKTPRKSSKKSSSSSLSSSMESVAKTNDPTSSLISLGKLPEYAADYDKYHNSRLYKILVNKYDLGNHQATLKVILGQHLTAFEITNSEITKLFEKFPEIRGSHYHGSHKILQGLGITLDPLADGINKECYFRQLGELKQKVVTITAKNLTVADYDAAHNHNNNNNNNK